MSILVIVLMSIAGIIVLLYFSGLYYASQATTNPVAWRIQMVNNIRRDTVRDCKRYGCYGLSVEAAHKKAINHYYKIILDSGNPTMYQLFMEMTQDEFPKQLVMFYKKIYGENYKSEYANIQNNEEMLEIIKSERAVSGGISGIEKMYLDKMIPLLNIENEAEIIKGIPHILVGFEERGFPTTFEEIRVYLSERLGNKQVTSAANTNETKEDNDRHSYTNEIQKHLHDLGCTLTAAGCVSAMALKHDRRALDQAISFYIGAIVDKYFQFKNLIDTVTEGKILIWTASNKIKNYYENGQISKLAYQSVISTLGSCLNPKKADDEKELLELLIKQNYLGDEKLVSING